MSTPIPTWWFVVAAVLSAALASVRLSRFMATARQRRSVAIGLGAMFAIVGGQAAIKHQGTPIMVIIYADAALGLLAMTVGMGGYFRNAALVQSQGQTTQATKAEKWRLVAD